jgi:hypothetical protein
LGGTSSEGRTSYAVNRPYIGAFPFMDPRFFVECFDRVVRFERYVKSSGLFYLWRRIYRSYYGMSEDGYGYGYGFASFEVGRKGEQGELAVLKINSLRQVLTRYISLATSRRLAMNPLAENSDYETAMQVRLAKGVIDHYMYHADIERLLGRGVEYAALLGSCHFRQGWNASKGKEVMPPPGFDPSQQPGADVPRGTVDGTPFGMGNSESPGDYVPDQKAIREGDLECRLYTPIDVILDVRRREPTVDWLITRTYMNKHDVATKYPERKDDILRQARNPEALDFSRNSFDAQFDEYTDDIPVYEFWHSPSDAVPDGRYALFVAPDVGLHDEPLPYSRVPIQRLAQSDLIGTPWGYTPAWDALAPQEAQDALASIILSNQKTFGVGNVLVAKGSDIDRTQLGQGLNMILYTPGLPEPKPLNLTQTPREILENRDKMTQDIRNMLGVNNVSLGDPEASLKSGSALALVQAQAVEFSSDFQKNIILWQERCLTDTVDVVKRFVQEERLLPIVGKNKMLMMKPFTGASIERIQRIQIQEANPMAKTLAGRVQMADTLVERGMIPPGDIGNYFRIIQEGSIEPAINAPEMEKLCIQQENDMLADGMVPQALVTDKHASHIPEHLTLLSNPMARTNPVITHAVFTHVQEHIDQWTVATLQNPTILEVTGQAPLQTAMIQMQQMMAGMPGLVPPQQPQAGPPGQGGGGAQAAPGQAATGRPSPAAQVQNPMGGPPRGPSMPNMPKNPATGNRYESPGAANGIASQ